MSRKKIICILICLLLFLGMLYFISSRTKSVATGDSNKISSTLNSGEVSHTQNLVTNSHEEAKEEAPNKSASLDTAAKEEAKSVEEESTQTEEKAVNTDEKSKAVEEPVKQEEAATEEPVKQEEAVKEPVKEEESVKEEPVKEETTTKEESPKEETPAVQTEEKAPQPEISQKSKEIELEIKDILRLNKIEFETASAVITPNGEAIIVKIAEVLKKYPNIKVEIAGHTDSAGNKEFNQKLSQQRADSVKEELIKQNIDSSRLTAKGYGDSKPLVTKGDSQDIQENRRVEFHIIAE